MSCAVGLSTTFLSQSSVPEIVVQTGHSANVLDLKVTTDGKYLISGGKDNRILIWDRSTQKQFKEFSVHSDVVSSVVLHPTDPNLFYSTSLDGKVYLNHLQTDESKLVVNVGSPISEMIYLSNKRQFVLGSAGVLVYSDQFEFLASYDVFEDIGVFNDKGSMVTDLDVSDDERVCTLTSGAGKAVTFSFEGDSTTYGQQKTSIEQVLFVNKDKKVLQCYSGGALRVSDPYGIGTKLLLGRDQSIKTSIDTDGKKVYVGTGNGNLLVVNPKSFWVSKTRKISTYKLTAVVVDQQHNELLTADESGKIFILNLADLTVKETYEAKIKRVTALSVKSGGKRVVVSFQNNELNVFDLATLQMTACKDLVSKKSRDRYQTEVVDVAWEGENVKVTFLKKKTSLEIQDRYDYVHEFEGIWNLETGKLEKTQRVSDARFANQYERGALKNGISQRSGTAYLYPNKLKFLSGETGAINGSATQYFNAADNSVLLTHDDVVTSVAESEHYIASSSWDGSVCFWNKSSGLLLARLYLFDKNQFALFDASDYYYSSKDGIKNIGFRLENEMYSFEQFDLLYNRPDKVFAGLTAVLGEEIIEDYQLAYHKRLQRLDLKEENLTLDVSEIPQLSQSGTLNGDTYELKASWDVKGATSPRLHVYVNGVPEHGVKGLAIDATEKSSSIPIELEEGNNTIVSYISTENGMKSLRSEVVVKADPTKSTGPNLYLVTIGCSKYVNEKYDLDYASKDALDVAEFLKKSKSFEEVKVKTILDEQVSVTSLDDVRNFIQPAAIGDVVIVYVAGHGVLSKDYDLYLATHDMDFHYPETNGIAYAQLEEVLESSASRHKCLFLDACHSGEIDKTEIELAAVETTTEDGDVKFRNFNQGTTIEEQSSFQLSKNLFADMLPNHGITIVSSAGGSEFALEGDTWKNGVFTYSFLSGLSTQAADLNKDGKVMLSEITKYVLNKVVVLTHGAQNPTSRIENIYNDIEIY